MNTARIKGIYPIDAFGLHCLIRLELSGARDLRVNRIVALLSQGYAIQPMAYPENARPVEVGSPLVTEDAIEEWVASLERIWSNPVALCRVCHAPISLADHETTAKCLKCNQEWSCEELIASPRKPGTPDLTQQTQDQPVDQSRS